MDNKGNYTLNSINYRFTIVYFRKFIEKAIFTTPNTKSQIVKNEIPKNNPNEPPNSAKNDVKGYKNVSSLTVMLLLENPKMKPFSPEGSSINSISWKFVEHTLIINKMFQQGY